MKKFILKFILFKLLVGLLLLGHCAAQVDPHVYDLAHAIAKAEGFGVSGALPTRNRNPGDIRAHSAHDYPGQVGIDKKRYAIFRNDLSGWTALYHQLEKVFNGDSRFYGPSTTFAQFSKRYAEDTKHWLKNVCGALNIDADMTLGEFYALPRWLIYAKLDQQAFAFNFTLGELQP